MTSFEGWTVEPIPASIAQEVVVAHHYLHRRAPCSQAFGLFAQSGELVGVVMYGVSASSTLRRGIAGDDEAQNVYELTRLWIDDSAPKNSESFLIGNSIRQLDKEIVVSFADASQNHVGIVYQATNFIYTGLSAAFRDPKVKGLEHQHHTTYAKGMSNKDLRERFGDALYYVDRARKHRYVFINARGRRRKELLSKLRYPILPYPKA